MDKTNEKNRKKLTVKDVIIRLVYMMWMSGIGALMTFLLSLFWDYEMADWQFTTWDGVKWVVFGFGVVCWGALTALIMVGVPFAWVNYWKKKTAGINKVKLENEYKYKNEM